MVLNESYTGQSGTLVITSTEENIEIPVNNVTVDVETSTTEVQHNDDLTVTNVPTSTTISGSFEYEGINVGLLQDLTADGGNNLNKLADIGTLVLREGDGSFAASGEGIPQGESDRKLFMEGIQLTSVSRDVPSDDVASTSVDFVADEIEFFDGAS